ncbi:hypothetical protein C0585_02550 [Candidatus Woesearchaeota archaeon]|mgnify:CR=1 FL=1|nr:MAG: hypothetical protein C0585_02550 [Candidatus Woesearchaeota archaeon]
MKSITISVFTSPTCPHCPSAVNLVKEVTKEDKAVKMIEYGAANPNTQKKAAELEVQSVPTIFVKGEGYEKNIGFRGTPSKNSLIDAIKIAKGEKEYFEPKPFSLTKWFAEKTGIRIKF